MNLINALDDAADEEEEKSQNQEADSPPLLALHTINSSTPELIAVLTPPPAVTLEQMMAGDSDGDEDFNDDDDVSSSECDTESDDDDDEMLFTCSGCSKELTLDCMFSVLNPVRGMIVPMGRQNLLSRVPEVLCRGALCKPCASYLEKHTLMHQACTGCSSSTTFNNIQVAHPCPDGSTFVRNPRVFTPEIMAHVTLGTTLCDTCAPTTAMRIGLANAINNSVAGAAEAVMTAASAPPLFVETVPLLASMSRVVVKSSE
jgi:hypothetical protein